MILTDKEIRDAVPSFVFRNYKRIEDLVAFARVIEAKVEHRLGGDPDPSMLERFHERVVAPPWRVSAGGVDIDAVHYRKTRGKSK